MFPRFNGTFITWALSHYHSELVCSREGSPHLALLLLKCKSETRYHRTYIVHLGLSTFFKFRHFKNFAGVSFPKYFNIFLRMLFVIVVCARLKKTATLCDCNDGSLLAIGAIQT